MNSSATNFNLLLILVNDLSRQKLRVLLSMAAVISAMCVILSTHHNRQQIITLEQLMREKDGLDVEWRNLVLEQRALTEHNRIEAMVQKQLNMHRPSVDEEVVVKVN